MRKKQFNLNDKVLVNSKGGWKRTCVGSICSVAEPVETLQGSEFFYWVEFNEPEEDVNGTDKYSKAQILSQYISHTT